MVANPSQIIAVDRAFLAERVAKLAPKSFPPLIAFVDERLERLAGLTRIIAGCCVFGRDRWMALHQNAASVGAVGRRRRLAATETFLEGMGGMAVLVYADIPPELLPPREIDGTDDVPISGGARWVNP